MGARMVPANGQTTKTKKILLYVVLAGKTFHLITNIYIRVQFLFSKRGACFYWVPCFYWDIYGMFLNCKQKYKWTHSVLILKIVGLTRHVHGCLAKITRCFQYTPWYLAPLPSICLIVCWIM